MGPEAAWLLTVFILYPPPRETRHPSVEFPTIALCRGKGLEIWDEEARCGVIAGFHCDLKQ